MAAGLDNSTTESPGKKAGEADSALTANDPTSNPTAADDPKDTETPADAGTGSFDSLTEGASQFSFGSVFSLDGDFSTVLKKATERLAANAQGTLSKVFDQGNPLTIVDAAASVVKTVADGSWASNLWDAFDGDSTPSGTKAGDTAKPTDSLKVAPELKGIENSGSAIEKAASWLGDWFFGHKHGAKPGDKGPFVKDAGDGIRGTTDITPEGVHNVTTRDGKVISDTRVDAKGATDVNERGDIATFDRINKTLKEKGIKGAIVTYDQTTKKYTIEEGRQPNGEKGRQAEINAEGDVIYTDCKGREKTIDNDWIQHGPRNGFNIRQARRKDESPGDKHGCGDQERAAAKRPDDPTEPGKREISTVTDAATGQQMIVVNDGQGTVMKLHQDGRKIITSNVDGNEIEYKSKPDDDRIIARIGDKEHFIERNKDTNQWEVHNGDHKNIGRVENGKLIINEGNVVVGILNGDKLAIGTSSISGDGTFSMESDRGQVRIDSETMAAVIEDKSGTASSALSIDGRKSALSEKEPGESGATLESVTTVDTANQRMWISETTTTADGQTETKEVLKFDGEAQDKGGNFLDFNTNDGWVNLNRTVDANGKPKGIEAVLWNNDKITDNGDLNRDNGVEFNRDGTVKFPDGTMVDEYGEFFESEEEYEEYEESSDEDECEDGAEQAAVARLQTFMSYAASIRSNPNPTAGDLAFLHGLAASIGAAVAQDTDGCISGVASAAIASLNDSIAIAQSSINNRAKMAQMNGRIV